MLKNNCFLEMSENGDELLIILKGEIDHHSAVRIRSEIDGRISRIRPRVAVLDLSTIDFMDSSGLGLIMGRYAKMQAIGGRLTVRNPNERIVKIFKLAGLERIVSIENGETEDSSNEEK